MAPAAFNPTQSVRFDIARGTVRAGSGDDRLLLVPVPAIVALAQSAPAAAAEAFVRALGSAIGRRAAARIGDATGSSLEDFVTHLAGEAAIAGAGVLSIERWGRALVVVLEESPLSGALVAPFVAAALDASSGRKVATLLLSGEATPARVLVSSEGAVGRARAWMASGLGWGEAITRLHGGGS
jgi:hypothetical protein